MPNTYQHRRNSSRSRVLFVSEHESTSWLDLTVKYANALSRLAAEGSAEGPDDGGDGHSTPLEVKVLLWRVLHSNFPAAATTSMAPAAEAREVREDVPAEVGPGAPRGEEEGDFVGAEAVGRGTGRVQHEPHGERPKQRRGRRRGVS
jgi:hypothetical protein